MAAAHGGGGGRLDQTLFHFKNQPPRQDESLPPIIPTIVRHYKSGDTDTGKNAGENKSEDKDKCKDTGDLKDSEDL